MGANIASLPKDTLRVCKLSGSEKALRESRLLSLRECEKFLEQCIRDTERAIGTYSFYRKAELAARVVLVTCDVAIMYLEKAVTVVGGKPVALLIEKSYSGSKFLIDALSSGLTMKQILTMIVDNKARLAELAASEMGHGKAAKAIEATRDLLSLASTLWDQITGAAAGSGAEKGMASAVKTTRAQLAKIQLKIRELEAELANC
jgi:hypothetical protein